MKIVSNMLTKWLINNIGEVKIYIVRREYFMR